jgi:hypothetical protein
MDRWSCTGAADEALAVSLVPSSGAKTMKIRIAVAIALLAYPGMQVAQEAAHVEDTIAGITVGKSKLSDVQKKFGARLILDPKQGRHAVKLDGQCEVFFDLESADSNSPTSHVTNIELANLGTGAERGSPCDEFSTGRGMKLSSSPDSMTSIYGLSTTLPRDRLTVDKFSNDSLCEDKHKHAFTARTMFIEWVTDKKVIQRISTDVEPANCDDVRATPKS